MFIKDLVSIVTPCYNGEKYLANYFEAIISQSYHKIEIIIVNDGSTDNSEKIIKYWEAKVLERGYLLKYIYQANGGLPNAINTGLKYVSGEFLIWPDCDDQVYPKNSIEIRVDFFKKNKEIGIVRGKAELVHENNPNKILHLIRPRKLETNNMFLDMIFEKTYITPGTYMIRTSYLKKANPKMKIYDENRAGQNWQILLPLVYRFTVGFVDNVVHRYFYHATSMSHNIDIDDKYNWKVNHYLKHKEILFQTIKSMKIPEEDLLISLIQQKYDQMNYLFAVKYNNTENLLINYKLLANKNSNVIEKRLISLSIFLKHTLILKIYIYIKEKKSHIISAVNNRLNNNYYKKKKQNR